MNLIFKRLCQRLIELRCAEVCTIKNTRPISVLGISAALRERRNLPRSFVKSQKYLRLESVTGNEAWHGPFILGSGVTSEALASNWKMVGKKTSVACALNALNPVWDVNPSTCAVIESALLDLVCRMEKVPLWYSLRPNACIVPLNFYGSALGLSLNNVDILIDVINARYPIAKWTINPNLDIDLQIKSLSALGLLWQTIALDGHNSLSLSQAQLIHRRIPSLAWLEDPFSPEDPGWKASKLPQLVVGEQFDSPATLLDMAVLPSVFAVNLEVEKLGITRACKIISMLRSRGHICLLHGRSMILSSHLAIAFPETVYALENHLVFAPERLATVCPEESEFSPWRIMSDILTRPGCGAEPGESTKLVARETVL